MSEKNHGTFAKVITVYRPDVPDPPIRKQAEPVPHDDRPADRHRETMSRPGLQWTSTLSIMGLPARFEADDEALLDAALQAFAVWRSASPAEEGRTLRIQLARGEAVLPADPAFPSDPSIETDGRRLRIAGIGGSGEADADTGEARCTVSATLSSDPERLAAELLDTLLLFLLTRSGRIPLHAAGFLVGETAALLAGPSGSGKSTLALAAHSRGLPVLSDDTVYLQLEPRFRVWGFPRPIHLLPAAGAAGNGASAGSNGALRRRGGRWKLAIPTEQGWPNGPVAERARLWLLEPGSRVSLGSISPTDARDRLMASLEPGFDHFREALPRGLNAVMGTPPRILTLSRDPAEAIAVIHREMA